MINLKEAAEIINTHATVQFSEITGEELVHSTLEAVLIAMEEYKDNSLNSVRNILGPVQTVLDFHKILNDPTSTEVTKKYCNDNMPSTLYLAQEAILKIKKL